MSAPPSRQRRTPLHERSQSQNNTLAIRIVPYTPPRLQAQGRSPARNTSPSCPYPVELDTGAPGDDPPRRCSSAILRSKDGASEEEEGHRYGDAADRHPRFALPPVTSFAVSLESSRDQGVSGSKLSATGRWYGEGPKTPTTAATSQSSRDGDTEEPTPAASPSSSSAPGASTSRPLSRRRNFVAVHSDKTFSLVSQGLLPSSTSASSDYGTGPKSPPLSYSSRTSSSYYEGHSSGAFSGDDRSSSPLTSSGTIPDYSLPLYATSPSPLAIQLAEDPTTASPWNYRMVGGLRKVPKTPDLKQTGLVTRNLPETPTALAVLPEASTSSVAELGPEPQRLLPKASFNSSQTASTTSETTNYKVYGDESLAQGSTESLRPSSSRTNFHQVGESSPAGSFVAARPDTADSDQNYILHGDPSPSASVVTVSRRPRPTYSQESLLVPPLRPGRKGSNEGFGYRKPRSRENLRVRAGSIRSIRSISSIISEGAAATFLAGQTFLRIPNPQFSGYTGSSSLPSDGEREIPWAESAATGSPSGFITPRVQMIPTTPHQWSSQLSTVMSESEGSSGAGRRSSRGWASSTHSRLMPSISSSIAAELEQSSQSRPDSRSESIDRPQPSYARSSHGVYSTRMVRDQDEHGDGLADLHEINQRPSRTGLSGFFAGSNSSERNLHSSASSRSPSLSSSSSIPAWARVYYGSGERRFLAPPSESSISESGGSRPSSIFRTGSPAADHFPLSIYSPRRRAREVQPPGSQPFSDSASMDITPLPPMETYHIRTGLRKMTSSIWSPHLRTDRRADRYSLWEPPSISWSAESGILGRRNIQVVMFTVGFIFPFAWMTAAVLPLPPNPHLALLETDTSHKLEYRFGPSDDIHYQSARWWRTLNRCMSVVGLLIIGAIVALVVVSVREGWSHH
ncbi:Serine-rich protein [Pleurostoma richardsiae]|uniref:Serine-rich protein n=1 Tax=Pleurostoma richardsiae TaxID=41990 RepID=A0AA38RYH8_9PEZI|nr:Serine-rich protein [Pleurostoma richardsiae]